MVCRLKLSFFWLSPSRKSAVSAFKALLTYFSQNSLTKLRDKLRRKCRDFRTSWVSNMRKLKSFVRNIRTNERGNVLILMGLTMPLLVGLAGLGTDTIQWTLTKQQLQRSADSAALNGAYAKAQAESVSANANSDLTKTLDGFTGVGVTIENAPVSGNFAGNTRAVKVILTYSKALPFSSMFISNPPLIKVEAIAAVLNNGDYCVISLEDTGDTGITFTGSSIAELGCGVVTNSTGDEAIIATGATKVFATPVAAVGYIPPGEYEPGTDIISYSVPQRDPYAGLEDPTSNIPFPCKPAETVKPNDNTTLYPGCYAGIKIQGTAVMSPGTYFINKGDFETNASSIISADGVTIILTGTGSDIGQVKMNGGASINMKAPTTGTYAGVLFYKDRNTPPGYNDVFNGGASGSILGAIYMPTQKITLNGNSNFATNCLQLIARKIEFSGNTKITNNCPVGTNKDSFVGTQVRLVG